MENLKQFTDEEWQRMSNQLQKQLGPEYLAQRPGPSGRPLTYIEGKTAINIANDIFGFNGWSTDIKDTTIDFVDVSEDQKYSVGVSVTIRITLRDGSYHEDMGYGTDQNSKSKGASFEKARKQAVTDATKRTLRYFGNALGNCLYDNPYLNGIGKMAKPTIKFTAKNLYRHDQFETKQTPSPAKLEEPPKQQAPRPAPPMNSVNEPTTVPFVLNTVKPEEISQNVPKAAIKPNKEIKSNSVSPVIEYKSAALLEPIVPEDSFTYEGDDEFLVQVLAVDDGFTVDQEFEHEFENELDDELLAGIITPPPKDSSHLPAHGSQQRDTTLSDLEEPVKKKHCIKHI